MKKILQVLLTLLLMLGSLGVYSQISEGGTPPSFTYDLVKSQQKVFSVPITFDVASLKAENEQRDESNLPSRVSEIIPVNLNIKDSGEWTTLSNGQRIWRLSIKAPNAIAMMLYYDEFYIPKGGQLFIYNHSRSQVLGAYTSNTNPKAAKFATEFVAGDELTLEYVPPFSASKNVVFRKSDEARIQISSVGYGYNYLSVYDTDTGEELKAGNIGRSGSCQVNINCIEGDKWQDQKKGVVRTITPIGSSGYLCTGTMMNNTVQDLTPYLLTASHCFYDDNNVETTAYDQIMYYFHLEDPGCERGPARVLPATTKTMVGASKLVDIPLGGGQGSDGGLVRLNNSIPLDWNVYFNGWDNRNVAATSGVSIHHSGGDVKKISTFTATATSDSWNYPGGALYGHWNVFFVATPNGHSVPEGGASGAPIFNQDGRVVGTLTGGNSSCTVLDGRNLYGKLWYHWDQSPNAPRQSLKMYLDPINTGVTVFDGTYEQDTSSAANFSASSENIYALESVTFVNYSIRALTNNWTFEGGTPNSSTEVNPPAITYNAPGVYEAKLVINQGTASESTKVLKITVTEKGDNPVVPVANFALSKIVLFEEGFDLGDIDDFPPKGWIAESIGTSSNKWIAANAPGEDFVEIDPKSEFSAMVPYDDFNLVNAWLKTPTYTIPDSAEMVFYAGYGGLYLPGGSLTFYVSTDNGATWIDKWTTGSTIINNFPWAWRKQTIDLSDYGGKDLQFAWQYYGQGGDAIGVDGVLLSGSADPNLALSINVGDYVSPMDLSTGPPVLWEWKFDGGIPETSTDPAPKVRYMVPGTYDISLTVKSFKGEDTRTFKDAVKVVGLIPEVSFSASVGYTRQSNYGLFIPKNTVVNYKDKSKNYPSSWNWKFGGGTPATSSEQNPVVTYNTDGEYELSLEVGNTTGKSEFNVKDFVKVGNTTDRIWNMEYGELGQTVLMNVDSFVTGSSDTDLIDFFAERFDKALAKGAITSVDILFHVVSANSGSLTVSILADDRGYPGKVIQSVDLLATDINPDGYTTVKFPIPATIEKGQAFFVSVGEFEETPYVVAIASSDNRLKDGKNTAFLNNWLFGLFFGESWYAFDEYYSNVALSLNIVPEFTYTEFELVGNKKHTRKNIDSTVGELSVKSNLPWKVATDASWINITTDMQNNTLSFTVRDNNGYPRSGLIAVSTIDDGYTDFILVEQAAAGPSNLTATVVDEKTGDILLTWDAPLVKDPSVTGGDLIDGAENHPDFRINSPGELGWSYIDGDGASTFRINEVTFPNEGMPMAFNVFNPSVVGRGNDFSFTPHGGQKYFTSFGAVDKKSNDWMISPQLEFKEAFTFSFWAKSYTIQYGAERLRVAYSTSGKSEANFTNVLSSGAHISLPATWTKYEFTVPASATYVAINSVSDDAFFMMVDDFFIGTGEAPTGMSEESIAKWGTLESMNLTKKSKTSNNTTSRQESMSEAELKLAFNNFVSQNKQPINVTDLNTGEIVEGFHAIMPVVDKTKPLVNKLVSIPMQPVAKQIGASSESNMVALQAHATATLRWDDGEPAKVIGLVDGGKVEAAIRFAPTDVMAYNNSTIKAVDLFVATMPAGGINLKIYQGTKLVHSQKVSSVKPFAFTRISLSKEVLIDASQDLYVSYEFVQAPGEENYVLVTDSSPVVLGKGSLISIEGSEFVNATNNNWSMAVIVEDIKGENYQLSYQVYRDDLVIAKTKELSQADVLSVTQACYNVTAVYNNQLESTSTNYACVTLDEIPRPFELDAEIFIEGVSHNIEEVYNMGCSNLTRLNVVAITNEGVKLEFVVDVERPIVKKEFTLSSKDGSVSKQYILTINKYLKFEDVIVIRWNNTLAVVNNPTNNYDYTFVKYQWYRNNVAIAGANKQYYSVGPNSTDKLNPADSYHVEMTTSDGQKIRTCAKQPSLTSGTGIQVYPNPVSVGGVIHLDTDMDIETLKGATLDIYNILGMRISSTNITGQSTSVTAPSASGLYILNLKAKNGIEKTFKIIVR